MSVIKMVTLEQGDEMPNGRIIHTRSYDVGKPPNTITYYLEVWYIEEE